MSELRPQSADVRTAQGRNLRTLIRMNAVASNAGVRFEIRSAILALITLLDQTQWIVRRKSMECRYSVIVEADSRSCGRTNLHAPRSFPAERHTCTCPDAGGPRRRECYSTLECSDGLKIPRSSPQPGSHFSYGQAGFWGGSARDGLFRAGERAPTALDISCCSSARALASISECQSIGGTGSLAVPACVAGVSPGVSFSLREGSASEGSTCCSVAG
jgi:hypothetical protein